jgi:outer membrane protein OmpA-like peptidoglycan-associated protein
VASLYGHDALDGGDGGGPWPALSDLLAATTLLFCVLFAVTVVPAIRTRRQLGELRNSLDSLYTDLGNSQGFRVERVGDYLRVTIGGDVVFPRSSSELQDMSPAGRAKLAGLARTLTRPATLRRIDQIQIVGHTSSEGSDERNWRLSSERAGTVALFLVGPGRLPVCKVTALGRGRFYPTDPARAHASATPNPGDRRIELEIRPVVLGDSAQARRRRDCVERVGDRAPAGRPAGGPP